MAGNFWEIDSVFNPLRSLNVYKDRRLYSSSLLFRFLGFFYLFAGKLHEPEHIDDYSESNQPSKGCNHIGIFDLFTLGIPFFLESFFRGNFRPKLSHQQTIKWIFSPVVLLFFIVRNGLALIPTLLISPLIVGGYCWDQYQLSKEEEKAAKKEAVQIVEDNLNQFEKSYNTLMILIAPQSEKSEKNCQKAIKAFIIASSTSQRANQLATRYRDLDAFKGNKQKKEKYKNKVCNLRTCTREYITTLFSQPKHISKDSVLLRESSKQTTNESTTTATMAQG